jgi:hypothetical protein
MLAGRGEMSEGLVFWGGQGQRCADKQQGHDLDTDIGHRHWTWTGPRDAAHACIQQAQNILLKSHSCPCYVHVYGTCMCTQPTQLV